jgi:hypothetical protein
MQNFRRAAGLCMAFAAILLSPISATADPIVISVTAPPVLSTLIDSSSIAATSWSQTNAYADVSIAALVDSAVVGQTPTADAYLTTEIGPGTTVADEIARSRFMVPAVLPICSANACGAYVTLFSTLSLGPGTYFVTMGPDPSSIGTVGWFPALNPTVVTDTGVSEGASFFASAANIYPPASAFTVSPFAMDFIVTGTAVSIAEPDTATMISFAALFIVLARAVRARSRR